MSKPEREYSNDEITVEWRPSLCIHCGDCHRGLPAVFNPEARPWVNLAGASTAEIVKQVEQCPSEALKVVPVGIA
jgi:uncharacterized Fe-S cluster protein YjdI